MGKTRENANCCERSEGGGEGGGGEGLAYHAPECVE
jgi:hypothetical protein